MTPRPTPSTRVAADDPNRTLARLRGAGNGSSSRGRASALATSAGLLVASRVLGSALTLAYTLLLARVATPEAFGTAMAALSYALLLSLLLTLNVESGSIRFLTAYAAEGRHALARGFLRFNLNVFIAACCVGALLAVVAAVLMPILGPAVPGSVLLFTVLAVPPLALARVYGRHATALDAMLRGALPRMLVRPMLMVILLLPVLGANRTVGAGFVAALFLLCACATVAVQRVLIGDRLRLGGDGAARSFAPWRDWLSTGVALSPNLVLREHLKDVVLAVAALSLGPAETGVLAIAIALIGFLQFAVKAIDVAMSPDLSRAIASEERHGVVRMIAAGNLAKLCVVASGSAVAFVAAPAFLSLLGEPYVGSETALRVLLLLPLADALFGPGELVLTIGGRRAAMATASSVGIGAIVAGTSIGGFAAGTSGVAAGAAAGYVVSALAAMLACERGMGLSVSVVGALAGSRSRAPSSSRREASDAWS